MKQKLLILLSACSLGWTMQACTDFQEGAAIGAIAGGIIGHQTAERPQPRRCYNCYQPGYRGGYYGYALEKINTVSDQVAQKYNIPIETADLFVSAIQRAENRDYGALSEIGLQKLDAISFYNNKPISDEGIQSISLKIGFEPSETKALMADMSADVQAEKVRRHLDQ